MTRMIEPFRLMEPPEHLLREVMQRIGEEEQLLRVRRFAVGSAALLLGSCAGLVVLVRWLVNAMYQSGFLAFLSLTFSDRAVALSSWQDTVYSLLESLPVASLLGTAMALLLSLASLRVLLTTTLRDSRMTKQAV